jgi:hypothetical protein
MDDERPAHDLCADVKRLRNDAAHVVKVHQSAE